LQWVRTRWFLLAQGIPLVAVLLALLMRRMRRTRSETSSLLADLKRVKDAKAPYPQFLRDLETVLRSAVQRSGGSESVRARVNALIQRIEAERFAPSGTESVEREALLREAELLLRAMQREQSDKKAHASVLIVALALVQAPAPVQFQRGAELYRAGHFTESARAFEKSVAADSLDMAAWVNLGNAHYRAGDRGRAIWAWARAAQELPRDRDIVRNLQAAGAIEVLRTRPPLSVRPVEWYLLAAIAWWVACALAVIAFVRRRNMLLSWALAPIALVVIALTVGVLADGRKHVVAWNEQTRLYGDPTVHSPVVRRVQAGAGLDIIEDRGDWLRVRTFSGAEGWVESDTVGKL
jgi:tetratricopeptide (TPR) repeat protein